MTESLAAALVSMMAIGVKINTAIHIPINGDNTMDCTRFSPVVMIEKYTINIIAATTIGAPKPPFLMIEPKGAPIKKRTISVTDKANFRWNSIQ